MNLDRDPRDETFREEVRAFLREHLTPEMATRGRRDFHPRRDDQTAWTRALATRGWVAPHWPAEYGGPGWRPMQRFIFEEEMRAGFAPTVDRVGTELVGPVLYTFGSPEQKARYLPEILNGERVWCQGFSEPGAGSDLAGLRTRAVRDGDHYVVNGQKTWTTEGHHADMMFALVRTDPVAKPQRGISALLIDMTSPGLVCRPIYTIDEGLSVNEVFFDDVRVPAENLVGEANAGWSYAKFLLGNERTNSAEAPHTKRDIAQIEAIARIERRNGRPLIEDPAFATRLARIRIDTLALEYAIYRVLADEATGGGKGANAVASVLKVRGSELRQRVADLAVEALGDRGLAVAPDPEGLHNLRDDAGETPVPDHGAGIVAKAMFRRATTIYGGANEIQRTLIAKTILEL